MKNVLILYKEQERKTLPKGHKATGIGNHFEPLPFSLTPFLKKLNSLIWHHLQTNIAIPTMKQAFLIFLLSTQAFFLLHAQKQLDSISTYLYQSDSDSILCEKTLYRYNIDGLLASDEILYWDSQDQKWYGTYYFIEECIDCIGKNEYEYDGNGQLVVKYGFFWSDFYKQWQKRTREEYGYNERGLMVSFTFSRWDPNLETWNRLSARENDYDEQGRNSVTTYYLWDTRPDTWVPTNMYVDTFDSSGRIEAEVCYGWDKSKKDWIEGNKTQYYYDVTGLITEFAYCSWEWVNNKYDWKEWERQKVEIVLNASGQKIRTIWYGKTPENPWNDYQKEEYYYGPLGQLIKSVKSYGRDTMKVRLIKEWTYSPEGILVYEKQTGDIARWPGYSDNYILERFFDKDNDKTIETWYRKDQWTGQYINDGKYFYHYKSQILSNQNSHLDNLSFYPNPTHGILSVSGLDGQEADISVITLNGKLVLCEHVSGGSIDLTRLTSGTYVLLLKTVNKPIRQTIITKN